MLQLSQGGLNLIAGSMDYPEFCTPFTVAHFQPEGVLIELRQSYDYGSTTRADAVLQAGTAISSEHATCAAVS